MQDNSEVSFLDLKIERPEEYEMTLKDVIISLFGVYPDIPIETRTLLYKELFLTFNEVLNDGELIQLKGKLDPKFLPYVYGPFSFVMASEVGKLIFNNVLDKTGSKRNERFKLTKFGKYLFKYLKNRLRNNHLYNIFLERLSELRLGWDKLGVQGIMNRLKQRYPEYFLFGTKGYRDKKKMIIRLINNDKELASIHNLADVSIKNLNELEKMKDDYIKLEKENGGLIWAELFKE